MSRGFPLRHGGNREICRVGSIWTFGDYIIGMLPSNAQTLYIVNPIAVFYGD